MVCTASEIQAQSSVVSYVKTENFSAFNTSSTNETKSSVIRRQEKIKTFTNSSSINIITVGTGMVEGFRDQNFKKQLQKAISKIISILKIYCLTVNL